MRTESTLRKWPAGLGKLIRWCLGPLALWIMIAVGNAQPSLKVHNFVAFDPVATVIDPYRTNTIWIATSGGLMRYNTGDHTWQTYTTAEGLSRIWCSSLFVEKDFIFVGTTSGGANLFNLHTERFIPFAQYPASSFNSNNRISISSIHADSALVWLGSDQGLLVMDRATLDTLRRFRMSNGLASDYVNDIADDGTHLWLATGFRGGYIMSPPAFGGLTRVTKSSFELKAYRLEGMVLSNYLNSVLDIGNHVYVAGEGGLFLFNKDMEHFTRIAADHISSLSHAVADGNDVWAVGYSTSGEQTVFCIDLTTNELKYSVRVSWPAHWAVSLAVDEADVYVLSQNSFRKIIKSSLEIESIALPFLPASYWTTLYQDQPDLYAAGMRHLSILDENTLSIRRSIEFEGESIGVRHITLDAGSLWLGTDRGLYVYDRSTLKLQKSYFTNPLRSIQAVVFDETSIWVNAHYEIFRIHRQSNTVESLGFGGNFGQFASLRILDFITDEKYLWVTFRAAEDASWITGVAKIDRSSKTVLQISKIPVLHYDHAFASLIDRGTYLLASGKQVSKISKEDLSIQPFLDYVTDKMVLKGLLLWTTHIGGTVRAFHAATGELLFVLDQSSGILHEWITDLSVSNRYAWIATWQGMSAFRIPEEYGGNSLVPPPSFLLYQNYPNPFNPSTEIRYQIPEAGHVTLKVFDVLGRVVATLAEGEVPAGIHRVSWDASGLPTGIYLYRFSANSFVETRRMLLLK